MLALHSVAGECVFERKQSRSALVAEPGGITIGDRVPPAAYNRAKYEKVWNQMRNANFSICETQPAVAKSEGYRQGRQNATQPKRNHKQRQELKNAIPEALLATRWDCMQVGTDRTK